MKDMKLREIADEFNISQSRISRIIQSGLDRIKKELIKQGII
jgi:DNA-directed RNA polymerase specialized sigma subunit